MCKIQFAPHREQCACNRKTSRWVTFRGSDGCSLLASYAARKRTLWWQIAVFNVKTFRERFEDEAQTALFKDPVRTAL